MPTATPTLKKTPERILTAALKLFNEQGERNVTTNHIAQQLNISPGNLYYHFKNKQAIIKQLFLRYEQQVDSILQVPEGRKLELQDKLSYLLNVFQGLWDFRFIHRDMEHLLSTNPELQQQYKDFFQRCLKAVNKIYQGLADAGIIQIEQQDLEGLALNTWIVVTSWFSFLQCNFLIHSKEQVTQDMVTAGIYQVFCLERPYLTEGYREQIEAMQQAVVPKPSWL